MSKQPTFHELKNGRKYRVIDTELPYVTHPTENGGFVIHAWEPSFNNGEGMWLYICNSPDKECLDNTLKLFERGGKLEDSVNRIYCQTQMGRD